MAPISRKNFLLQLHSIFVRRNYTFWFKTKKAAPFCIFFSDEEVDHKVILCCAKTTLLHSGSQSSQSTQENPPFATDATAGFHMDPHQMWALLLSAQSWLAANSRGNSLRVSLVVRTFLPAAHANRS